MDSAPDSTFDPSPAGYGISQVSRIYGPGSITAWLLLTLYLLISTFYFPPSEQPWALDNLLSLPTSLRRLREYRLSVVDLHRIVVFAFPLVAALDLLRNLDVYTTDPRLPALFDAPFMVVNLAKAACFLLLLAEMGNKLFFTPAGQARRALTEPSALYPLALVFFQCVDFWAYMHAKGAEGRDYFAAVSPAPEEVWVWAFGQLASPAVFVARYEAYLHDIPNPRSALWSPFWVSRMSGQSPGAGMAWIFLIQLAIHAVFGVLTLLLMTWDRVLKVEAVSEWLSRWLVTTFGDWVLLLGFADVAMTVVFLVIRGWGEGLVPRSRSAWGDLDQMVALIIAGFFTFMVWRVVSVGTRRRIARLELEEKGPSLGRISTGKLEHGLKPAE